MSLKAAVYRGSRPRTWSPAATALVLVFLAAHAFVVSATHLHSPSARPDAWPPSGTRLEERQDARDAVTVNGHAQCLLCRLQRHLSAGLRHGIPQATAPQSQALCFAASQDSAASPAARLFPSGRAPPE